MQFLHLKSRYYQNKLNLSSPLSMRDQVSQPTELQGTLYGIVCLHLQVLRQQTRRQRIPKLTEVSIPELNLLLFSS